MSEFMCRGTSILVTLSLMRRLEPAGYGRIEWAFNIVFWLVLIVRDFFETIITRELARKPQLTTLLVNRILTMKLLLASVLYGGLLLIGFLSFSDPGDRVLLAAYGFLLFSTALGLDFVYRGSERINFVAFSLIIRSLVYSVGVWCTVYDATRIKWVPIWLVLGELFGIGLVWVVYARKFGCPKPRIDRRFFRVMLARGRSVCLIHFCQTVVISADLVVVGLFNDWGTVGRYGAPLRMITAAMAFGTIFQQVVFPSLARSRRQSAESGRLLVNQLVRLLLTAFVPLAVGTTLLSGPLVAFLFSRQYADCGILLAVGIWRAPLFCLAFLYQASLIAMNRESSGVRLLAAGALVSFPLTALAHFWFGLVGASVSVAMIGFGLVVAGYLAHRRERRQPAWHHQLLAPMLASAAMVPVCLLLLKVHLIAAAFGGAVAYAVALYLLGGLHFRLDGQPLVAGSEIA